MCWCGDEEGKTRGIGRVSAQEINRRERGEPVEFVIEGKEYEEEYEGRRGREEVKRVGGCGPGCGGDGCGGVDISGVRSVEVKGPRAENE